MDSERDCYNPNRNCRLVQIHEAAAKPGGDGSR